MRALVFNGSQLILTNEYPLPEIRQGEARIKVLKAGLCQTDIEIVKGYMNFQGVLGHEFVGRVEEASEQSLVGKRVVGEINLPCGTCDYCRQGLGHHCPHRQVLGIAGKDGALADYITLPEANLHQVSPELSTDEALFTEPLAAALRIIQQLPQPLIKKGRELQACVLGDGKLGLLVAQVLNYFFREVVVIGKHQAHLNLVSSWGMIPVHKEERVRKRFKVVVEATGGQEGLFQAIKLVEPQGIIFLKSTIKDDYQGNLAPLVVDEIMLIGSRCGPFREALKWLQAKKVKVLDLIEAEFPFEQAVEALEKASKPGALKVIINLNADEEQ